MPISSITPPEEVIKAIQQAYACGKLSCACHRIGTSGSRTTHCPTHDDKTPSLSLAVGNKGVPVFKCRAGCPQDDVLTHLKAVGLWHGTPDEQFIRMDIVDEDDPWSFFEARGLPKEFVEGQGVRLVELPNVGTGFQFRFEGQKVYKGRPLHVAAKYLWFPKDAATPPFWPMPPAAPEGDHNIVICAGETDCMALRYAGIENAYAVTKGEDTVPWLAAFQGLARLGYEEVTFLYDLDDAGVRGAKKAAEVAGKAGLGVKIAQLPPKLALRGVKDVCDVLAAVDKDKGRLGKIIKDVLDAAEPLPGSKPETLEKINFRSGSRLNAGELQRSPSAQATLRYLPLLRRSGFIVRGWSHMLGAYSKVGKTELLRQVMTESPEEKILYFTEEPQAIWEARLGRVKHLGDHLYDHLELVFALGMTAEEILRAIQESDETIVILDTARNLLGYEEENDNAKIAAAFNPFILAARRKEQTLIILHHDRKTGGEHGKALAGAGAFLGVVDVYLGIERVRNAKSQRVIKGVARIIEIPDLLYELQEGDVFKALGRPQEVQVGEVKKRVAELFKTDGEDWLAMKAIQEDLGDPKPSRPQISEALTQLTVEGLVERDPPAGDEAKGKTYRWRLRPKGAPPPKPESKDIQVWEGK